MVGRRGWLSPLATLVIAVGGVVLYLVLANLLYQIEQTQRMGEPPRYLRL